MKATAQMGGLTRFEIEKMRSYDPNHEGPLTPTGLRIWQSICDLALQALSIESVRSEATVRLRDIVLGEGEPGWQVWLEIGNQRFPVGPAYDVQSEAEWYAQMLRKALSPARVAEEKDENELRK